MSVDAYNSPVSPSSHHPAFLHRVIWCPLLSSDRPDTLTYFPSSQSVYIMTFDVSSFLLHDHVEECVIHLPPPLLHPGMSVYGCVCRQAPTGQRQSASQRWPQVNCLLSFAAPPCRTSVCTCTTMQDKCLHVHNHAGQVSARAQPCRTSVCTCTTMQDVSARAQPCRTSVCTCTTMQDKCLHVHNHAGQVSACAQPCRTSVCTCTTMQDKCLHVHNHAGQVSARAQPCRTSVCTCRLHS